MYSTYAMMESCESHLICVDVFYEFDMKRRIRVIPFESSFKADIKMADAENRLYPLDKSLHQKVGTWKYAFMGLLLQGYKLYVQEGLTPCPKINDATKSYEEENNTYGMFLEESCARKLNSNIPVSDLGRKYMEWSILRFGYQSIKYRQENKYTPKLTEELEKDPWRIKKEKQIQGFVYVGLAFK